MDVIVGDRLATRYAVVLVDIQPDRCQSIVDGDSDSADEPGQRLGFTLRQIEDRWERGVTASREPRHGLPDTG